MYKRPPVRSRNEKYKSYSETQIWQEQPHKENAYLAERCICHGYDFLELITKRDFIDVLYLLFQGELPTKEQKELLEKLLIAFINPGPRHPATQAAMLAGVGKTETSEILPVATTVLSGDYLGGGEVSASMLFLKKHFDQDPEVIAQGLLGNAVPPKEGDWHIAPGFGCRFGGIDPLPQKIAAYFNTLPGCDNALRWGSTFARSLEKSEIGWLTTGVCAAALLDLGFSPLAGAGLYQIICSPGLLAHGIEMYRKPRTAMPFPEIVISPEAMKKGVHNE